MEGCCLRGLQSMVQAQILSALPHHILRVRLGGNLVIVGQGNTDAFPVDREENST